MRSDVVAAIVERTAGTIAVTVAATVIAAVLLAVGAWVLAPHRRSLETRRMVLTNDHGVALLTYSTPDEMRGLGLERMLHIEPGWLDDRDFYFPAGIPGDGPREELEWADWARGNGVVTVGWRHIMIRIQATQDRTVLVLPPVLNASRTPVEGGLVLSPVPELGGNGLLVRQFHIELDATPPTVEYLPEDSAETPQFKMAKGDSEAFLVIAHASQDRHSWTLDVPVLVDGETFHLRVDNHAAPFVTVGPSGIDEMWWDFERRAWRPAER